MVVDVKSSYVIASGVTVLDLSRGSRNGGKKTQAASSASRGDGENDLTLSVAIKLSEDDCDVDLDPTLTKKLQVFNGMKVDPVTEVVEPVKVPIRDPTAPAVTDREFIRLACDGHVPGVQAFVDDPANEGRVDVPRNEEDASALWSSAIKGRVEIVTLLLEAGASVDLRDKDGEGTRSHARGGAGGAGGEWSRRDDTTTTTITAATDHHFVLPKHHAGNTPLMATVLRDGAGVAAVNELLIDKGADVNSQSPKYGTTALTTAAKAGRIEAVELLIKNGARLDLVSTRGMSALHYAARDGHRRVCEKLLKAGADPSLVDSTGKTALAYATEKRFTKAADALQEGGALL